MQNVSVVVNGTPHNCEVDERTLVLELIRDIIGYTGTHDGCREAKCGCCAVIIDGLAVKSCNVLALQVEGANLLTIEGLAPMRPNPIKDMTIESLSQTFKPLEAMGIDEENLHPIQEAFRDNGAVQCGFCTPGMLAVTIDLLTRNPDPTREEVRYAISSNLCRCTGYQAIVDAVMDAAARLRTAENSAEIG